MLICYVRHTLALVCAKNHLLVFSSFLDIWENVEWPRFFGPPGMLIFRYFRQTITSECWSRDVCSGIRLAPVNTF